MMKAAFLLSVVLAATACGPSYERGHGDTDLDQDPMSLGLDKRDLRYLLDENLDSLRASEATEIWKTAGRQETTVAIFPFVNNTSQHLEGELESLLSETETSMVEGQMVTVISWERQKELSDEVARQQGAAFDPSRVTTYGKQIGAKYVVTGKVETVDERDVSARRVQYFFFMQAIDVETSVVLWQHKAFVTKYFG